MITLSLEQLQTICINIWNCSAEGDNGEFSCYSDEENNETIKKLVSIELDKIGKSEKYSYKQEECLDDETFIYDYKILNSRGVIICKLYSEMDTKDLIEILNK